MPKKSTITATAGTPRPKRQSGYLVTVKGFLPINGDFASHRNALAAMETASGGDLSGLRAMTDVTFSHKLTTRVVAQEPTEVV